MKKLDHTPSLVGWEVILKFVTPVLLAVTLAMIQYVLSDIREAKEEVRTQIEKTNVRIISNLKSLAFNQKTLFQILKIEKYYIPYEEFSENISETKNIKQSSISNNFRLREIKIDWGGSTAYAEPSNSPENIKGN